MLRCVLHLRGYECGDWNAGDRVAFHAEAVTCWACRWKRDEPKREAAKRKAARSAEIRRPPALPAAAPGCCRLCGGPVVAPRRSWCSDDCVAVWNMATSSRIAFYFLTAGLGSRCWECGDEAALVVDHVRPLWSLSDAERLELRWWLPYNLQLLGTACHKRKTAREARERALLRRAS